MPRISLSLFVPGQAGQPRHRAAADAAAADEPAHFPVIGIRIGQMTAEQAVEQRHARALP